jgi:hypothetical protein
MPGIPALLLLRSGNGHPSEESVSMITSRPTKPNETDRMPKNFPALQERMDIVKRSHTDKQQLTPRSALDLLVSVEKDDNFFLL